jgi:hypothetical protein
MASYAGIYIIRATMKFYQVFFFLIIVMAASKESIACADYTGFYGHVGGGLGVQRSLFTPFDKQNAKLSMNIPATQAPKDFSAEKELFSSMYCCDQREQIYALDKHKWIRSYLRASQGGIGYQFSPYFALEWSWLSIRSSKIISQVICESNKSKGDLDNKLKRDLGYVEGHRSLITRIPTNEFERSLDYEQGHHSIIGNKLTCVSDVELISLVSTVVTKWMLPLSLINSRLFAYVPIGASYLEGRRMALYGAMEVPPWAKCEIDSLSPTRLDQFLHASNPYYSKIPGTWVGVAGFGVQWHLTVNYCLDLRWTHIFARDKIPALDLLTLSLQFR